MNGASEVLMRGPGSPVWWNAVGEGMGIVMTPIPDG